MAIQYEDGTLISTTARARELRQSWAAAFIGKSGWTVEDANYVNGTTERTVITNSAGFSLMIYNSTTLSDTNVRFCLGQSYNATTHVLSNIGLGTGTTTNASGFNTNTFNPTAINTTPTGHGIKGFVTTVNQTAWSAHIDDTYAVLSFKDGTTNGGRALYFGEFDSLVENETLLDSNPYCLVFNDSSIDGVVLQSLGNNSVNHSWNVKPINIMNVGIPAIAGSADVYNINPTLVSASPIFLVRGDSRPSTTESSLYGWLRGKLKPAVLYGTNTNALWGDQVDLNPAGTPYMYVGGGTLNANNNIGTWTGQRAWWVEVEEVAP